MTSAPGPGPVDVLGIGRGLLTGRRVASRERRGSAGAPLARAQAAAGDRRGIIAVPRGARRGIDRHFDWSRDQIPSHEAGSR